MNPVLWLATLLATYFVVDSEYTAVLWNVVPQKRKRSVHENVERYLLAMVVMRYLTAAASSKLKRFQRDRRK